MPESQAERDAVLRILRDYWPESGGQASLTKARIAQEGCASAILDVLVGTEPLGGGPEGVRVGVGPGPYDEWPLGRLVHEISALIDNTYPSDLDREAHLLRRVMKVSEETGEVTEALFGALGENARKGKTHDMHDVRRELLDVALAALAAIAHFDSEDPEYGLIGHAMSVYERLWWAVNDPSIRPVISDGGDER